MTEVPRPEPISGPVYDECERDADCTEAANGYCVLGACFYGCVTDDDCAPGQLCYLPYGPSSVQFSCQTPLDECQSDRDCNEFDRRKHCLSDGARRSCVRDMTE